jgi:hypothetical protein
MYIAIVCYSLVINNTRYSVALCPATTAAAATCLVTMHRWHMIRCDFGPLAGDCDARR